MYNGAVIADRYEFHEVPDALVTRAAAIHASDKHAEKKTSQWGCGCLLAGAFLVASVIMMDDARGDEKTTLWVGIAALVAFCVLALVKLVGHQKRDLDDRKVATLQKLVKVLRADLPADRPVRLRVDFRSYVDGGTKVSESGGRTGPTSSAYAHEWLRVRGALADGTVADLALSEDIKRKEKPKRKRNKVKERITGEVTVSLRLGRQYGDAAAAAERLRSVQPPPGCTVSGVKGAGRRLHASLRTNTYMKLSSRRVNREEGKLPDADVLLQALRWTYRGISPR